MWGWGPSVRLLLDAAKLDFGAPKIGERSDSELSPDAVRVAVRLNCEQISASCTSNLNQETLNRGLPSHLTVPIV